MLIVILSASSLVSSSHSITGDVSIGETAAAAEFFLSDGLIISGGATAHPANIQDLQGKYPASDPHITVSNV